MVEIARKPRETAEIDLGDGAIVVARVPTTVETEAANAAMRRRVEAIREGQASLGLYGLDVDASAFDDADTAWGVGSLIMVTELALKCFVEWRGVTLDGAPADLTRENIAALLADPVRHRRVFAVLTLGSVARQAEGNGSAPSQNGAQAGAETTAGRAGKPARPARAARKARADVAARSTKAVR